MGQRSAETFITNNIDDLAKVHESALAPGAFALANERDTADLSWQESGLCNQIDPEIFHPEKGGSTRIAKKVCETCVVKPECGEYALNKNEMFGVWGGLSERDRRRLKAARLTQEITAQVVPDVEATVVAEVVENKVDRQAELVKLAANIDPTTPEFIAVIEEFFAWPKGGVLTSEQRLDCFFRAESGQNLSQIARSYGLSKAQIVGSVTWTQKHCTPELRAILIGEPEDIETAV